MNDETEVGGVGGSMMRFRDMEENLGEERKTVAVLPLCAMWPYLVHIIYLTAGSISQSPRNLASWLAHHRKDSHVSQVQVGQ